MCPPEFRRLKGTRGRFSTITPAFESQLRQSLATTPLPTLRELAASLGNVVSHQTIKTWCCGLGLPYGRICGQRTKLTPQIEKRLRRLVAKKPLAGYKEVATALHIPVQTVTDWIKRLGLPEHPRKFKTRR